LECVAVCCSVLQCVAVCASTHWLHLTLRAIECWSVLECVGVCCSVLECVGVCWSVLECVAVCCSVLQYVRRHIDCIVPYVQLSAEVYWSVLECVAVCAWTNWLHHTLLALDCKCDPYNDVLRKCIVHHTSQMCYIYTYLYKCIGIGIHTCKYIRAYTYMNSTIHICSCIWIYTCTYICAYTYKNGTTCSEHTRVNSPICVCWV